jgi:hypothetical protein
MIDSTYLLVDSTSETKKLTEKRVFLPSEKTKDKNGLSFDNGEKSANNNKGEVIVGGMETQYKTG